MDKKYIIQKIEELIKYLSNTDTTKDIDIDILLDDLFDIKLYILNHYNIESIENNQH